MGLFSFIKKAVGKVAQAGLSFVTHGASDKVIKAFKGQAGSKSPRQQEALIAKVTAPVPRTSRTEVRVPGWGFNPSGHGAERERKRMPGRRKARYRGDPNYDAGAAMAPPRKKAKRARKPAAARSAGGRRSAPKGGLDLKAIGALWRAGGNAQGGTWQQFVKAHSDMRT